MEIDEKVCTRGGDNNSPSQVAFEKPKGLLEMKLCLKKHCMKRPRLERCLKEIVGSGSGPIVPIVIPQVINFFD